MNWSRWGIDLIWWQCRLCRCTVRREFLPVPFPFTLLHTILSNPKTFLLSVSTENPYLLSIWASQSRRKNFPFAILWWSLVCFIAARFYSGFIMNHYGLYHYYCLWNYFDKHTLSGQTTPFHPLWLTTKRKFSTKERLKSALKLLICEELDRHSWLNSA